MSDEHELVITLALNFTDPMGIHFTFYIYSNKTRIPEIPNGYGYEYGDRF